MADGHLSRRAAEARLDGAAKRAADVSAPTSLALDGDGAGALTLTNDSAVASGDVELFALTGTSPRLPAPTPGSPGSPGSNVAVTDLAATGVREAGDDAVRFGIATYDRRTVLPYPVEFDVFVDSDNDGVDDYVLYNVENGGFATTGQTFIAVFNLRTQTTSVAYYDDGGFNSSTQIFTAPKDMLGLTSGQTFSYSVYALDNYFSGSLTDSIVDQVHTLGDPKYTPTGTVTVGADASMNVGV